jgi:hypothetical protein
MGSDEALVTRTAERADHLGAERRDQLAAERRRLGVRLRGALEEDERERVEPRLAKVCAEAEAIDCGVDAEEERILRLFIEHITYHPDSRDVDIELRPCGIQALAAEAERSP